MAAWGMKNVEIKQNLKCSDGFIAECLKSDVAKDKVKEIQEKIWGRDPKKWIESLLPDAIKTAYEIMTSTTAKESVRLAAAEGFIDRSLGKAPQKIEVNDSTMRKVIEKLDAIESLKKKGLLEEDQIIEAEFEPLTEKKPETKEDEIEKWIKENYA
jgi:hypothetical protein